MADENKIEVPNDLVDAGTVYLHDEGKSNAPEDLVRPNEPWEASQVAPMTGVVAGAATKVFGQPAINMYARSKLGTAAVPANKGLADYAKGVFGQDALLGSTQSRIQHANKVALGEKIKTKANQVRGSGIRLGGSQLAPEQTITEKILSHVPEQHHGKLASTGTVLGRGLTGVSMGYDAADAWNRLQKGDVPGAVVSGVGTLGGLASLVPHPVVKGVGTAVSMGAPVLNTYLDKLREEKERGFAGGGHIQNFDEGGRPDPTRLSPGAYVGYPQIHNRPRKQGYLSGLLEGATGLGDSENMSVLDPNAQAYLRGKDIGDVVGLATMIPVNPASAIKSTAKFLAPKAASMAENYMLKQGLISPIVGEAAKLPKTQKFSEAIEPYIGTHSFHPTIVDRTKLDLKANRMAGPEAPYLQEISKPHKESGWIFANDSLGAASKLYNMGKDGNTLVTGLLGSPTQLKTNRSVFGEIADEYFKAIKAGKMSPELQAKIEARLPTLTHGKEKIQTFPNKFDIRDRDAFNEMAKGFHQRGHLADIMGGKGVSQGVPGGGKIIPYEDILNRNTELSLTGAPTHSIGSRLFTVGGKAPEYRPDLHNAFDWANFGELKSGNFGYVPKEIAYPDEIARIKANLIARGMNRDVTAMDIMRNSINQPITEKLWRNAQDAGFAGGGSVAKKALDAAKEAYKAKFTSGFYHGSPSNKIKDFDPTKTPGDVDMITPGATFVTRDKDFAESFLPMTNKGEYKTGATIYPVSVNLGKHFHPHEEEGRRLLQQYAGDTPLGQQMAKGDWTVLESPDFMNHLKSKGYDSMTVFEGGVPNVAVFDPKNIRGKFAKFNPKDAESPDFMKAEGGPVEGYAPGGAIKPLVNRINMHFKDVTKRIPELQESAKKIAEGTGSREAHEALVSAYKPVLPFDFVPTPATREEAVNALHANKKELYGVPSKTLPAGHPVGLRLDIPAYSEHGVWVPTIHEQASGFGAGKAIGHESVASVLNPAFGMSDKAALSIASGKPKGTIATIKGEWNPIEQEAAVAKAQEYLNHPEWRQVGMDPERHGYFYDRATMEPITHAEEALQIGPLVLAKKPVYGKKEDFKFADGGEV